MGLLHMVRDYLYHDPRREAERAAAFFAQFRASASGAADNPFLNAQSHQRKYLEDLARGAATMSYKETRRMLSVQFETGATRSSGAKASLRWQKRPYLLSANSWYLTAQPIIFLFFPEPPAQPRDLGAYCRLLGLRDVIPIIHPDRVAFEEIKRGEQHKFFYLGEHAGQHAYAHNTAAMSRDAQRIAIA